ncbi:MAG: xanthine dehydrogenase family protein molybdopterin-binding subunit [Anaerolineae bacterium]
MMDETRYIGKHSRRLDAVEKVTGRARFVGDYYFPNMLHARVLRSPLPHARIVKLDVTPALEVPGVIAAITSEDFVDHGSYGFPIADNYILAHERVRYVGEAIAAVAAETPEAAEAGLRAIVLELEPLPGVFDAEAALEPDAPLVGPTGWDAEELPRGNLAAHNIVRNGEPDPLFAEADVVYEGHFTTPRQEHAYIEPEGAVALPTPEGGVIVYADDQSPFVNRNTLMRVLGLPQEKVRVVSAFVGGAFGGKDDICYETSGQAAALALKAGRPVRLIVTREESMIASYKREPTRGTVRLAATRDGRLQAAKVELLMDNGAYSAASPFIGWRAAMHAAGAYRYKAAHIDVYTVYTNNGWSGAFRGFGNTDAALIIERAVDELAEQLGMDPLDFRLRNALREGDRAATGNVLDFEVGLIQALEWVRAASDWDRKRAAYAQQPSDAERRRGIGVACIHHGTSLGAEGADFAVSTLTVNPDNSLTLTSGLTDYGQGSRTVFPLVAAEVLGVDVARIHMPRPDTETARDSGPTVASRASILGGNATRVAAEQLRRLLHNVAADLLGCQPEQIVRHGEQFIGPSEEPVTFEDVTAHARALGLELHTTGRWDMPEIHWDMQTGQGKPYSTYSFGAQVAEVEVDLGTGKVQVLGIWAAHDGGQLLFPIGAYGQMYGGVVQGLGYGLLEEFTFDHGYPRDVNYDTYLIPTSVDAPEIEAHFVETRWEHGPFGAKNLAEPVMIPTAPALLNAIAHATGRRLHEAPATLERVLLGRQLRKKASRWRLHCALGREET